MKNIVIEDLLDKLSKPTDEASELAPLTPDDQVDEGAKNFNETIEKFNETEVKKFKSN